MGGLLQGADFKTEAELVTAGATKASLLDDTKIYITAKGINETLDDAIVLGKIGGGAGGINYITNTDFESAVTGWVTYADAAASTPTDGTGGSPNVTFTRNTTTPLRGTADGVLTKDAVNRQGQGVAYDFTIDNADYATPMTVKFDYKASANFSYANGDVAVFLYSKDGSSLIPITPNTLDGSGHFVGEFQTEASPNNDYRLIFHVATTNANAYTLNIDNVQVGPTKLVYGNLQDKQYALTITGTGWNTVRAVGIPYKTKDGAWRLRFNANSNSGTSQATHTLTVAGVTFKNTGSYFQQVSANQNNTTVGDYATNLAYCSPGASTITVVLETASSYLGISGDVELESMPTWATDFYPVQLSDGAETRVVACSAYKSSTSAGLSGISTVVFNTVEKDTHSAYSASTGIYTVPVAGWYEISGSIGQYNFSTPTANYVEVSTYYNATQRINVRNPFWYNTEICSPYIAKYFCNVGDTLKVQAGTATGTFTLDGSVNATYLNISRVSGPATIAASEVVAAKVTGNSAGTGLSGTVDVTYTAVKKDTHGAFNISTGIYTTPSAGWYAVSGILYVNTFSTTAEFKTSLLDNSTGSFVVSDVLQRTDVTTSSDNVIGFNTMNYYNAGTQVKIQVDTSAGTFSIANPGAAYSYVNIHRI